MQFKTVSRFDKEVKELAKKYFHIKIDIQNFIVNFDKNHQAAIAVKANIFKARIKNSDKSKGKSAGYRTYYYMTIEETVYFLTMYDKSEKESIDEDALDEIISSEIW